MEGGYKVLFFVTAKAQKTQVKVFPVRTLGYSLASTSPLEKRLEKWFRNYNSFQGFIGYSNTGANNEYVE